MAKTPEAKQRDPVVRWAKGNGILHFRMSFRPGVRAGVLDDLFVLPGGRHVWIEFKAEGKAPTRLQLHRIRKLREQGAAAEWFDNTAAAIDYLRYKMR